MRHLFMICLFLVSFSLSAQKISVVEIVQIPSTASPFALHYYTHNWLQVMDTASKAGIIQHYEFEQSGVDTSGNIYLLMTAVYRDSIKYSSHADCFITLFSALHPADTVPDFPLKAPVNCRVIFREVFRNAGITAPEKKGIDNPGHLE